MSDANAKEVEQDDVSLVRMAHEIHDKLSETLMLQHLITVVDLVPLARHVLAREAGIIEAAAQKCDKVANAFDYYADLHQSIEYAQKRSEARKCAFEHRQTAKAIRELAGKEQG